MKLTPVLLVLALFAFLAPLSASAVMFTGSSLHGSTGELTMTDNGSNSIVTWSLDTSGFDDAGAMSTDHRFLTDVAFKISGMTSVSLASGYESAGDLYYSSNVNNHGCDTDGSRAGFACLSLASPVDATVNQIISYSFIVEGDLDFEDELSFRGKYGDGDGWVISESSPPVPEPSAALLFAVGMLAVGGRSIRR